MMKLPSELSKPKKRRCNREHELQSAAVLWFRYQYSPFQKLLFAIPNGGKRPKKEYTNRAGQVKRYSPEAQRLKKEGVVEGVLDLFLSVPRGRYHGVYLETKTEKGTLSDEQEVFIHEVQNQGYKVVVYRTIEQFMSAINDYMKL